MLKVMDGSVGERVGIGGLLGLRVVKEGDSCRWRWGSVYISIVYDAQPCMGWLPEGDLCRVQPGGSGGIDGGGGGGGGGGCTGMLSAIAVSAVCIDIGANGRISPAQRVYEWAKWMEEDRKKWAGLGAPVPPTERADAWEACA